MKFTPLHLDLLVHYTVSCAPFHPSSPTAEEYCQDLFDRGLVSRLYPPNQFGSSWGSTDKGKAVVELFCSYLGGNNRALMPDAPCGVQSEPVESEHIQLLREIREAVRAIAYATTWSARVFNAGSAREPVPPARPLP